MKTVLIISVILLCFLMSGCGRGLIYHHVTKPLDLNLSETPNIKKSEVGDVKHLQYYVSVVWDSNGIGDIARKKGMKDIDYADLETLSVLGIWNQYTVHVYGQ